MFEVSITQNADEALCVLKGSLNTRTAPEFREKMGDIAKNTSTLVLDLKDLRYISSAGLRVILALLQQLDDGNGRIVARNCSDFILEVFEDTGFTDMIDIERDND